MYQNGKTVRGPMSSLKFTPNPRRSDYRLAVVVSKKVNKSAVARNRIRRRLYEAVRKHDDGITEPFDMVLTVFDERLGTLPAEDLQTAITKQLKQAKIVK